MKKSLGAKTLLYPTPVLIVGSYDSDQNPNVMTVAWGGICCSKPPCTTISLRKATYSYCNIMEHKAFTINIPSEEFTAESDYFGMASGKNENKFEKSGLTAIKSELVDAPYIKEFPMVLECKVIQTVEIGLHTQFIGEIMDVKVDESILNDEDTIDLTNLAPIFYAPGLQQYYSIGKPVGRAYTIGKKIR